MSEQRAATSEQEHPAPEGRASWQEYWTAQGMPWRTEPEIDAERQRYLTECRAIAPNVEKGLYPFKDITLDRADVEWLLATHESGGQVGPVQWNDPNQKEDALKRLGINLAYANLQGAKLQGLPLANTCMVGIIGGRQDSELSSGETVIIRQQIAVHLEGADLRHVDLTKAVLSGAYLNRTDLSWACLVNAKFSTAFMGGADLFRAQLMGADLREVNWDSTTSVRQAKLATKTKRWKDAPQIGDLRWNGANLTTISWEKVKILGDERVARQRKDENGKPKKRAQRDEEFDLAVRANRQLVTTLRSQGENEQGDRFASRALRLRRIVLRRERKYPRYLGSAFLNLTSGYGYRPIRSFITYLLVVGAFAFTYYLLGNNVNPPLDPLSAVVFSITSFHGRGFIPGENVLLNNPLTVIAACEAIVGLLLEIILIATFTQRFFAR
jgi:uncharacterized protein YjbI with pentapeptide repeats